MGARPPLLAKGPSLGKGELPPPHSALMAFYVNHEAFESFGDRPYHALESAAKHAIVMVIRVIAIFGGEGLSLPLASDISAVTLARLPAEASRLAVALA